VSSSKVRIFDNEAVELLGVLFKRNQSAETFAKICELSHNLLQSILRSEGYPHTEDVYHYLYLQMERWITKWVPGKGHLYAYLSASTKNAAVSYTAKETLFRQKIIGTDVPLEDLVDNSSSYYFDNPCHVSEIDALKLELESIEVRWPEPDIRDALRYCFITILEGRARSIPDRARVLRYLQMVEVHNQNGTSYMLNQKQAKVLLAYAQGAVRVSFLNAKIGDQRLTEVDLLKLRFSFHEFSDIEDVVGTDAAKRLLTHFAGRTIKFPSVKTHAEAKRLTTSFQKAADDELEDRLLVVGTGVGVEYIQDADGVDGFDDIHRTRQEAIGVQRELSERKVGSFRLFEEDADALLGGVFEGYGEGEQ